MINPKILILPDIHCRKFNCSALYMAGGDNDFLCFGLALMCCNFVIEKLHICRSGNRIIRAGVQFFAVNLGKNINFITLDQILIFQIL